MIYFASDIHLGSGDRATQKRTEARFVQWLNDITPTAEALFLVGDVFDFWFEYGKVVPKGFVRTLGKIAQMTDSGIRVVLITGNHDMWVGNYLSEECGIELYTSAQCFTLHGKRLFVSHGDNTNIKGQPLLKLMNTLFRSKVLRVIFSWIIHPDLFIRFGSWWSSSSRKAHYEQSDLSYLNPLIEAAKNHPDKDIDHFIFGHIHIPHTVESPSILFLGSWFTGRSWIELDSAGNISLKIDE